MPDACMVVVASKVELMSGSLSNVNWECLIADCVMKAAFLDECWTGGLSVVECCMNEWGMGVILIDELWTTEVVSIELWMNDVAIDDCSNRWLCTDESLIVLCRCRVTDIWIGNWCSGNCCITDKCILNGGVGSWWITKWCMASWGIYGCCLMVFRLVIWCSCKWSACEIEYYVISMRSVDLCICFIYLFKNRCNWVFMIAIILLD